MDTDLSAMNAVSCVDVCKTYRQGELEVIGLDHVSLEIDKGEFVSLSAPSGGGKTTLLNVIGALDKPEKGQVSIDGQRIDQLSKAERAAVRLGKIGFVFQAYNLIPVLTARENIEFVMQVRGIDAAERRERSSRVLAEVGLEGYGDRRPSQMSGGQQQRVAVARAIVADPVLVLADEPTANLDSTTSNQLMELFVTLNRTRATTFVIATHDRGVMSYTHRQVRLLDGRIVGDGPPEHAAA
jgi:putative ABC transport system ATP-binding protein